MRKIKRIISIILCVTVLFGTTLATTAQAATASASVSALPAEVKGTTLCSALNMDFQKYMDWLKAHEKNNYYIGTPYKGYDHRNPKGDCAGAYGNNDVKGVAAMNCTGFVWHVLYKATKASGGNTSIIPALSGWYTFYSSHKITRKYFSSKSAMLNSGYLEKGDIIWMFDGSETVLSDYHHIGIYWGDGKSDVLWHSIDAVGNKSGNIQTVITPKARSPIYMVLKMTTPKNKLELTKTSSNTAITNKNNAYSLSGAVYGIYTDKACTKKIGEMTTNAKGNASYNKYVDASKNYYGKELKAPKGYELDKTVYPFKNSGKLNTDKRPIFTITCKDAPLIKLQLQKSSSNTELTAGNGCYSLSGTEYGIYTDKACTRKIGSITTNASGYGSYSKYVDASASYYAKETKAPKGYELDKTVYTFVSSGKKDSNGYAIFKAVSLSDKKTEPQDNPVNDPVGIVLQKKNAVTGETTSQGLGGAVFSIEYYAQEIDKDYDVKANETAPALDSKNLKRTWYIQTDADGYCRLAGNYLAADFSSDDFYYSSGIITIPIGTVVIREVNAPDGYSLSDVAFYRVINEEIAELAKDTNTPINVPIDEMPAKAYIGIHKLNQSGVGVANAAYGLYADAECKQTAVSTLVTDKNGKGVFSDSVDVGKTYYIKEQTAPTGYELDETVYPVIANEENSTVETAVIQTIYEDAVKADLKIKKSSTDGIVSNLWFAISDNLGNEYNAVSTDKNGEATVKGLRVYDDKGNKITYTVKELGFKTTLGAHSYGTYSLPFKYNKPRSVTVTLNSDTVVFANIKNTLKTGSVKLTKTDGTKALAGSGWQLYKSDDTPVRCIQNGTGSYMYRSESESATDCMATNGTLLIRNLPVGDYYFTESVTPSGYMPYGKKVEFTISADNENTLNISLTVADNKSVLSQTGGGGIAPFYFASVALGAMAIIFIYDYHKHGSKKYKKSRKENQK